VEHVSDRLKGDNIDLASVRTWEENENKNIK
jgi:hypothetical protein